MRSPSCLRCRTIMQVGLLIDHTQGGTKQPEWAEGAPEPSFWTGLKLKGKERHPVRTYRCPACGYLESYAGD